MLVGVMYVYKLRSWKIQKCTKKRKSFMILAGVNNARNVLVYFFQTFFYLQLFHTVEVKLYEQFYNWWIWGW
jgi:hypothetical protein